MRILRNLFYSLLIVFLISAIGYQAHTLRVEAAQEAKGAGISRWSTDNGSGGAITEDTTIASGTQVIYSVIAYPTQGAAVWSVSIHDSTSSATDANKVLTLFADDGDSTTLIWSNSRGILVTSGIWVDVTDAECTIIREEPAFRPVY